MRYYTPNELRNEHKDEVGTALKSLAGKNVKYNFAIGVFKKYAEKLGWPKNAKILDLGTANGDFLQQIANEGYQELYAHDIDDYLPADRKKLIKEYRFSELSMEKLPWPDNAFDIVTAWCVIPHIENPFHAMREMRRVLKPGGVFVFTTLHLSAAHSINWFKKHGDFKSYRETNNHIALLPPAVVKKTTANLFEIIGTEFFVNPKMFRSSLGRLKQRIYQLAPPSLQHWLERRWAYNIAYLLRKKSGG